MADFEPKADFPEESPVLLDGKALARLKQDEIKAEISGLLAGGLRPPGLAVIMVGDDPASAAYVRSKEKTAARLGINASLVSLPAGAETGDLLAEIERLNKDPQVDALLIQMPLPPGIDSRAVIAALDPDKDVDGFHPANLGGLLLGHRVIAPCTPAGVLELLNHHQIPVSGRNAVIIGRSFIVGKPLAAMLVNADATVTICHSRTRDLPGILLRADIIVAALGRPGFIRPEMVRPRVVVVDVGINRVEDRAVAENTVSPEALADFSARGHLLAGDCHWQVYRKSAAYTPVPGGVGPMTVAMLMANTLELYRRRRLNGRD